MSGDAGNGCAPYFGVYWPWGSGGEADAVLDGLATDGEAGALLSGVALTEIEFCLGGASAMGILVHCSCGGRCGPAGDLKTMWMAQGAYNLEIRASCRKKFAEQIYSTNGVRVEPERDPKATVVLELATPARHAVDGEGGVGVPTMPDSNIPGLVQREYD